MIKMFHSTSNLGFVDNRSAFLLKQSKNKVTLHLGCVDTGYTTQRIQTDRLLHSQLSKVTKKLYGVDFNREGVDHLKSNGFQNLFVANIEQPFSLDRQFDVILAGEVIEHLSNPGQFLLNIKKHLKPNGKLIITIPNAQYLIGIVRMLKFNIETVHEDHVLYFSATTIRTILQRYGYSDIKIYGYSDISKLFGKKKIFKKLLNALLLKSRPSLSEGLIAISKYY